MTLDEIAIDARRIAAHYSHVPIAAPIAVIDIVRLAKLIEALARLQQNGGK